MSITITKQGISATGKGAQALFDAISARLDKPAPQKSSRPAKLQVNQSGAWRDALRFDLDALVNKSLFLNAAAEMVRRTGQTGTTMRIVSDEAVPQRFMYWNAEHGWKADENTPANATKPVPERPKLQAGVVGAAMADGGTKALKSKGA